MRLVVENIAATGRTVTFALKDDWAHAAAASALEYEPTSLSGRLEVTPPEKSRVEVAVHVEVAADRVCDRCGEPVRVEVAADVPLAYIPAVATPAKEDADDEPLDEAELDIGWYEGGELDLGQVLSEAIALQLPPRIACADVEACDARTEALLAAHAAKHAPPIGGLAGLTLPGGKAPRSNK
ncbi:MAG: DUF177 domain-containing protein [Deltaproteobacteria bacterium]|nr:DUF177 domain-containing protein [Deltaproteobacteria bacterium]